VRQVVRTVRKHAWSCVENHLYFEFCLTRRAVRESSDHYLHDLSPMDFKPPRWLSSAEGVLETRSETNILLLDRLSGPGNLNVVA